MAVFNEVVPIAKAALSGHRVSICSSPMMAETVQPESTDWTNFGFSFISKTSYSFLYAYICVYMHYNVCTIYNIYNIHIAYIQYF